MRNLLEETGMTYAAFRNTADAACLLAGSAWARKNGREGSRMYSLFSATGPMRKIRNVVLPIGSLVWYFGGYGNRDGEFVVAGVPDERGCQPLLEVDGEGRKLSWKVGQDDRPVSEQFGIGLYWDDRPDAIGVRYDEAEIADLADKVAAAERAAKEAEAKAAAEWAAETERLRKEFAGVLVEQPAGPDGWKGRRPRMKKNVSALLKLKFPGVKFRIRLRYSYGEECVVEWTGGPAEEAVSAELSRFTDEVFDGMVDAWDSRPSPFTKLYGGCKGHWCYRKDEEGVARLSIA